MTVKLYRITHTHNRMRTSNVKIFHFSWVQIFSSVPRSQTRSVYVLPLMSETMLGWDGVDWIDMAQDRDQCRALVNTVLNLRVP
jgi:hypothetical protein